MVKFTELVRNINLIPLCCVCKQRIRINNIWYVLNRVQVARMIKEYTISHTYCPKCLKGERAKMRLEAIEMRLRDFT